MKLRDVSKLELDALGERSNRSEQADKRADYRESKHTCRFAGKEYQSLVRQDQFGEGGLTKLRTRSWEIWPDPAPVADQRHQIAAVYYFAVA